MQTSMFETTSDAEISPCGRYRYWLKRQWNPDLPSVLFVMLNPSTADADVDDPTIRRCIGFAKRWGYGGIEVCNLFALRSTDPKALFEADDPVGPDNKHLPVGDVALIVAAWGAQAVHAMVRQRALHVNVDLAKRGFPISCLGLTKGGHPKHPLYLKADTMPKPYFNCAGSQLPQLAEAASSP